MAGNRAGADLYPVLRRRALQATVLTALAAAAGAEVGVVTGALSASAPLEAAAIPVALALMCAPALSDHPSDRLGPANHLTLVRAALVGVIAAFVGEASAEAWSWALVAAAALAFGLDWLDGRVARATGTASPFGARLDMELDGLTVLVLCALAWSLGRAGPWVMAGGAARYLFVASGWVWPFMTRELPPDPRRPWMCGVGITLLVGSIAPTSVGPWLAGAGVGALLVSFAIDVGWLWRHR